MYIDPWAVNLMGADYGNRKCVIVYIKDRILSVSWARIMSSHPVSLRSIWMLPHQLLGFPSGLFPSGFPPKSRVRFFPPRTCHILSPSHVLYADYYRSGERILTYLLTYSMVQSPSWAAKWFAATQEIPRISRNPKVHYRTHKRPPSVSILGQPILVHIATTHLLKIRPNIIHPSTPMSPQWSLSPRFPHQDPIHPPLLTHTRHMPSPSHSSRFYWRTNACVRLTGISVFFL